MKFHPSVTVLKQQERGGLLFRLRNEPLLNLAERDRERERDIEKETERFCDLPWCKAAQLSLLPFYKFAKLRHSPVVIFSIVFPSKPPFLFLPPSRAIPMETCNILLRGLLPGWYNTGLLYNGSKGIFQGEIMNRE